MTSLASETAPAIAGRITLRAALKLDAIVTATNAAAYLLAAEPLEDLLGLTPVLLRVLGVVLAAFAAAVWVTATRPTVPRRAARAIVAVNAAWALASIVVAIAGWMSPTTVGVLWIVAQAIVVAAFAELQAAALKR